MISKHDLMEMAKIADANRPKMNKKERYIIWPILTITLFFLGITAAFIDASDYSAQYYGSPAISYDDSYHFYPVLVLIAYVATMLLRVVIQGKILRMMPNLPPEKKVIRLTWDMAIMAILFIYLQLKVFALMELKF